MLLNLRKTTQYLIVAAGVIIMTLSLSAFSSDTLLKPVQIQNLLTSSQQEEQRLNDIASARWTGLAAEYQSNVLAQAEEISLH